MRKIPQPSSLADKLHKGFVCGCIAVTIYGCSVLGFKYYKYITEVKPQLLEKRLQEQKALLAEGSSDNLKDSAAVLRA